MKNLFDIQGQVVVITGGTGVLGREIGEYLALQGAKVVLMGRNEETGKQIVGGIRAVSYTHLTLPTKLEV